MKEKTHNLGIFTAISFLKNWYLYLPLLTIFLLSKNVPLSAVVYATMFYSVFSFLGEVPTGLFADTFGQKTSLAIGYLMEAFGLLMIVLFPTTIGLYIASSIQGLAGAFISGSDEALLFESVKKLEQKDYQKVYGRFLSNGQISFMIATAVAGLAYKQFGKDIFTTLMVISCISIAMAGVLVMFLKDYRVKIMNPAEGSKMFSTLKQSFLLIRHNKTIFTFTIVTILTISGEWFLFSVYQPYFEANSVPAIWIGLTLSIGTLINIILTRYIYLFERYFSVATLLLILNVLFGGAYILMAVFVHPVFLIGIYSLMNGILNLQSPIISDYVNSHTPSAIRATLLSGMSFVRRFFTNISYLILGAIIGGWGIKTSLIFQGVYLLFGIGIGYYLLVRCGCVYKVDQSKLDLANSPSSVML